MAFIEPLAERNEATFYMRGDQLYFGPQAQPRQRRRVARRGDSDSSRSPRGQPRPSDRRGPGARSVRHRGQGDRRHGEARRRDRARHPGVERRRAGRPRALVLADPQRPGARPHPGRGRRAGQGDPRGAGPGLRHRQRRVHRPARDRPRREHRARRAGPGLQQDLLGLRGHPQARRRRLPHVVQGAGDDGVMDGIFGAHRRDRARGGRLPQRSRWRGW